MKNGGRRRVGVGPTSRVSSSRFVAEEAAAPGLRGIRETKLKGGCKWLDLKGYSAGESDNFGWARIGEPTENSML